MLGPRAPNVPSRCRDTGAGRERPKTTSTIEAKCASPNSEKLIARVSTQATVAPLKNPTTQFRAASTPRPSRISARKIQINPRSLDPQGCPRNPLVARARPFRDSGTH
ncbi:hypothetical protein KM043_006915 [Ampulex compressa]|nr:hypothetical protein KM043_006915 [Ampulex compressa]